MEEESFPRGGRKINSNVVRIQKRKHQNKPKDVLFPQGKQSRVKRPRKEGKSKEIIKNNDLPIQLGNAARSLSYRQVQEGMLILGCIKKIKNISIEVELPGIIFARVEITSISDCFTEHLKNNIDDIDTDEVLNNMFKIGQFVAVKVMKVEETEKGDVIHGSINPADINNGRRLTSFKKGMLVWACVKSELDHGYHLTLGINNCNIFLPLKNIDDGKKYGEPLWAVIHKVQSSQNSIILQVSAKMQQVTTCKTDEINNLYEVIPASRFDFFVEKVRTHGVYGKVLENFFGYIDENQLNIPLNKVKEGKSLVASVLFVDHAIKTIHLTTYNVDYLPMFSYEIGNIKTAEIVRKAQRGLYLNLGKEQRGFITNRRLLKSIKQKSSLEVKDIINSKFPIGSKHTSRIVDVNYMEKVFICSFEKEIIEEKLFNINDIKFGELCNVKIVEINPNGLAVEFGHRRGFVPNFHISKGAFSEKIKKKFPVGTNINVRILNIHSETVIFTMKQRLVESDVCLSSTEDVNFGTFYPGVVVSVKKFGALVAFYNDIKGWISSKQITIDEQQQNIVDASKYFYIGQVVNFTVTGVNNGKLILSLKPPLKKLRFGAIVDAVVTAVNDEGLSVVESKKNVNGFIPLAHLSTNLYLCSQLIKTYKVGDKISKLMCLNKAEFNYILSKREAKICKTFDWNILKFENVKKGSLIRCFYESTSDTGIYVTPLLKNYSKKVLILKKNIVDKNDDVPSFVFQQSFVARVLAIDKETKQMQLCIKLDSVFNNNIEETFDLFQDVLEEEEYLKQYGSANGSKIAEYELGERVTCKVEQIAKEGGCLIKLPNGSSGLVPAHLCPTHLSKGTLLEGVILAHDFGDNYLEVSLKKDINAKISCVQNGETNIDFQTKVVAEKLLLRNNYALATVKQGHCNNQLVYLPLFLHENDFNTIMSMYTEPSFKIEICRKTGTKLVGISRRLKLALEKNVDKHGRKRKLSDTDHNNGVSKKKVKKAKIEIDSSYESDDQEEIEKIVSFKDLNKDDNSESIEDLTNEDDSANDSTDDIKEESEDEQIISDSDSENETIIPFTESTLIPEKEIPTPKLNGPAQKDVDNKDIITGAAPVLPGIASFYNTEEPQEDDSESEDEIETTTVATKKKKLSSAERAEVQRREEETIRKLEQELVDNMANPQSAEQFNRLVLANPNSSELWLKYMSFHMANMDQEKARAVAKQALEKIDMTLLDEKFNIWNALLHLENDYNTQEAFEKVFQDALSYNDPLKVYLKAIEILGESGKISEMDEKINKIRRKFKQDPLMWEMVGKNYYLIKKFKEARNFKDLALKSIQDKKTQFNLIVKFAIMEFQYGEVSAGSAIFETIVQSDPTKINVWLTYVNHLVKKGSIDAARSVFERSVCQIIPSKSMKTLFMKFIEFEQKHGTPETRLVVKQKLNDYINKQKK